MRGLLISVARGTELLDPPSVLTNGYKCRE
jgi:hypothetical protein